MQTRPDRVRPVGQDWASRSWRSQPLTVGTSCAQRGNRGTVVLFSLPAADVAAEKQLARSAG